jgi:hypothetical protein
MVPGGGFEPPTRGFSIRPNANENNAPPAKRANFDTRNFNALRKRCKPPGHEKAPIPDCLAAGGIRAETTGGKVARCSSDNTQRTGHASRIRGTLYLRVQP